MMKNKKGIAQFFVFLIFVAAILLFLFISGGITMVIVGSLIKEIPWWGWGLLIFLIIILLRFGGKK